MAKANPYSCYGIGVTRVVAAAIEQTMTRVASLARTTAPFDACIVPIEPKDPAVTEKAEALYEAMKAQGLDVLLDDRAWGRGRALPTWT